MSIDWDAVESDYRRGWHSLRDLAAKHACSHSAIANRARRCGWSRDGDAVPQPDVATPTVRGHEHHVKELEFAVVLACVHMMVTID
jgi:hypothetical protein